MLLPLDFPRSKPIEQAVEALATTGSFEQRGAVFTSEGAVTAILDLCRYTSDRPLFELKLLEPSFGNGDFLIPVLQRLLNSIRHSRIPFEDWPATLETAIVGVELHHLFWALNSPSPIG